MLGRFGRGTSFGFVPKRKWDGLDGLKTAGLQHVFRYYDGQTDDAALTRAVLRSAQGLGVQYQEGAQVCATELVDRGVRVSYRLHGRTIDIEASVTVNAAGPWAGAVARFVTPALHLPAIELVQGTHIQVPGRVQQGVYYVESPRDGRAVFVMPWRDGTLIGTTETRYRGNPEQVHPLPSELNYLLHVLRHYFPSYAGLSPRDLLGSFAGLRVLPAGSGHAFHRPRETLLHADREMRPRFLSILGGKLTGWRATSEQVMKRIAASLPTHPQRADTRKLRLDPA
jgi:glycerol-3-phosphate dehydrogenase